MHSLTRVIDPEPIRGDFDPANAKEVDRLMRAATIHYGERLAMLPASQREEVLEEARFGAIEAALAYDSATAKTTKWKTAAIARTRSCASSSRICPGSLRTRLIHKALGTSPVIAVVLLVPATDDFLRRHVWRGRVPSPS